MSKYVVLAVAKENKVKEWKDREGVMTKHIGRDVYVGTASEKYDGVMPMDARMVDYEGRQFSSYSGKVTIWDDKLSGTIPAPGDVVECEWTRSGSLRYVGIAAE